MIQIRPIDKAHAADILLKNDSFPLTGFLRPAYADGQWTYTVEHLPENRVTTMCFPDEAYDYDALTGSGARFLGAYDGEDCVGFILLKPGFFKYMYVENLLVRAANRRQGVGRQLIAAAAQLALSLGERGLYLQAQDHNLAACLFYLRCGFFIGGLDTQVYAGTSQAGKHDIIFYLDA